jgi:hypothetical protein
MPDRNFPKATNLQRSAALKLLLCLCAAVAFTLCVRAHEPITTKVRFNNEVVRVLQRNCLACHHAGGIAMSLVTYEEARPWAKAIKEEILEKRMPPWCAVKGYGEFRNAPALTQHEVDLIVNWVEGGAPKGDDKELPSGPLVSDDWPLGKPSLALKLADKVDVAADADLERTFVLETKLKEDRSIEAVDLRPGNASVVHCATIMAETAGSAAKAVRNKAEKAGTNQLVSSDQVPAPAVTTVLGTWMPGQKPVALPEGVAQVLPAGARIVVKIHYRGSGEAAKDQSTVGLYFAKTQARRQLREVAISSPDVVIPAGANAHRVEAAFVVQEDAEAIAIRPRAHPLVISLQATAYRPDGTQQVLIWTRGYRSGWQPAYYFRRPVALPKGTRIEVVAHFDNSEENRDNPNDPPKQVRWSELTLEPMCVVLIANSRPTE